MPSIRNQIRELRAAHEMTQQDLADRVGSSREMVNRIMKELTVGGYVSVNDEKQIVIHKKLPSAW